MSIPVPHVTNAAHGKPFQRVVKRAAQEVGVSEHLAGVIFTAALEGIVEELARGNIVRIPCFGAWFPHVQDRKTHINPTVVMPRFQASVSFRSQVGAECSVGMVRGGNKEYNNYMRNHNISRDPNLAKRAVTELRAMREMIRAEARRLGQDL